MTRQQLLDTVKRATDLGFQDAVAFLRARTTIEVTAYVVNACKIPKGTWKTGHERGWKSAYSLGRFHYEMMEQDVKDTVKRISR